MNFRKDIDALCECLISNKNIIDLNFSQSNFTMNGFS